MITITKKSLDLVERISNSIQNQTFHHHYHILYDIVDTYPIDYTVNYVEIGETRFTINKYEADGYFASECYSKCKSPIYMDKVLSIYNQLR
jgi:hypothetical protein